VSLDNNSIKNAKKRKITLQYLPEFKGKISPMSKLQKSPLFYFVLTLLAIVVMTFFGPEEATLGANVRLVYLHSAWS